MSNKAKVVFLAVAVSFTILMPQSTFAKPGTSNVVSSSTYKNVDEIGSKLNSSSNAEQSNLSFESVILEKTNTRIEGSVSGSNKALPFSLTGSLGKAEGEQQKIVGHLSDDLGNFDVVHFAIDRSGSKTLMFNRGIVKGKESTVLKLYLMEKNTRNLTVVELANPSFLSADALFSELTSLPVAERADEFWYTKMLQPIKAEEKEGQQSHEITPDSWKTYTVPKDYAISYNVFGDTITEHFNVQHYVSVPGSISGDGSGNFTAYMKVVSESTDSYYDGRISNQTSTRIGSSRSTAFDAYVSTGDAVVYLMWDGSYTSKATLDASFRWSKSYLSTNLGFTVTYMPAEYHPSGYFIPMDNSGTQKVRQVRYEWGQGKYLQNANDIFSTIVQVGNFDANYWSSVKTYGTKWTYSVTSGQDYTWGGEKTVNVYSTYGN